MLNVYYCENLHCRVCPCNKKDVIVTLLFGFGFCIEIVSA